MIHLKNLFVRLGFVFGLVFFISSTSLHAQDGKALFQTNCASCHSLDKVLTGPALRGVESRWPDRTELHAWILNSGQYLKTGKNKAYADQLFAQYGKTTMTAFQGTLDTKEIDAILDYIKTAKPPVTAGSANGAAGASADGGDNTLFYAIITAVLAIAVLILIQVNKSLKRVAEKKEG
ncbi:MAG: cytochrome C, partial [Pseudopedobacter saltans]